MTSANSSGLLPVMAATGGNVIVTICKFFAAFVSGSSAMFSEAIHSLADTVNQVLLLIGLQRSKKKADDEFEYGYGRERFFWALISACGVFFVGAGVTFYKGITALTHPATIELSPIVFGVLLLSLAIESYTFYIAASSLRKSFPEATWLERARLADPMTLAVFLEDGVAVCGVTIAGFAIVLSHMTDDPVWDALGSILISMLLAATAITLVLKNRTYLLGKSMPEELQEEVMELIRSDRAIEKLIDFKSSTIGWGTYRIKCEVEFSGGSLMREAYLSESLKEDFEHVREDYDEFVRYMANYSDRIPRVMGKRVDEIEHRIRQRFPEIHHIDIETN